ELRLAARPPARFSWLRSQETVNQKQEPWGNTLLAQRYPFPGNSYFWRTAPWRMIMRMSAGPNPPTVLKRQLTEAAQDSLPARPPWPRVVVLAAIVGVVLALGLS